jgi:GNAT superfamily N-acetyltransferase
MTLHQTDDAEVYAAAVIDFLDAEPCRRSVLRTVLESIRTGHAGGSAAPGFWWAETDGRVVGAASWTPPYPLVVTDLDPQAAAALAASAAERCSGRGAHVGGVVGPEAAARAVAGAWARITGEQATVRIVELLHQLDALVAPPTPPGAWRRAMPADADVVAPWLIEFASESGIVAAPDPDGMAGTLIAGGRCFVWEADGERVAMVCRAIRAGTVARIGPVYTPPPRRRRGYARRLTYEVTRQTLAEGASTAVLFTDAANPTSNSIYRQVGYRAVEKHLHIDFSGGSV